MCFVTSVSASAGNCCPPSVVVLGCDVAPAALALPVCTRLTRGAGPCNAGVGGDGAGAADDSTSGLQTATVPVSHDSPGASVPTGCH